MAPLFPLLWPHYPLYYNVTIPSTMTSPPPLLWRHYTVYYDVSIPSTMTSLSPLLWRHYPLYYDVTIPATMTSLSTQDFVPPLATTLREPRYPLANPGSFTQGFNQGASSGTERQIWGRCARSDAYPGWIWCMVVPQRHRGTISGVVKGMDIRGYEGMNIRGYQGWISGVIRDEYPGLSGMNIRGYDGDEYPEVWRNEYPGL